MGFSRSTQPNISTEEMGEMRRNILTLKRVLWEQQPVIEQKKDSRQIGVDSAVGKDKTVRTLVIFDEIDIEKETLEKAWQGAWASKTITVNSIWTKVVSGPPVVHEKITVKIGQNTWDDYSPLVIPDQDKPLFDAEGIIGSGTFLQEK